MTIQTAAAAPTATTATPDPMRMGSARMRRPVWRTIPPTVLLASLVLAITTIWAFWPALMAPYSAYDPVTEVLQPPSLQHVFGSDSVGRDLFSRVIYGTSESFAGALVAVGVGLAGGLTLGSVAGSAGGRTDSAIMRVVDVLLAIPGMLVALTVVVLLGSGTTNAAIAIGIGSIAGIARLIRSEVVRVRESEYIEAAYGSGGSFVSVLATHILPNSIRPILALIALQFGGAILALSALGFLGYGVSPPTPEWGMIIAQGRNLLGAAWWVTAMPGFVLIAVVLATNRLSHAIGESR